MSSPADAELPVNNAKDAVVTLDLVDDPSVQSLFLSSPLLSATDAKSIESPDSETVSTTPSEDQVTAAQQSRKAKPKGVPRAKKGCYTCRIRKTVRAFQ